VKQIFVTHHHNDHTGSLADIVEQSGAQVLAHKIEAPVIKGEQPPHPPATSALRKMLRPVLSSATEAGAAAGVDRELEDGDEIDLGGGAIVLHVPGHTMGSAALFIPKHKMLFAGDAAVSTLGLGPPSGPFGLFNEDREEAAQSFKKLAALEFDVAFFGHGKPMDYAASILFRRAAEQLN
jgi:glyoxylase-like metal-dependent hydrolase (beta-lactamase superfamily II)